MNITKGHWLSCFRPVGKCVVYSSLANFLQCLSATQINIIILSTGYQNTKLMTQSSVTIQLVPIALAFVLQRLRVETIPLLVLGVVALALRRVVAAPLQEAQHQTVQDVLRTLLQHSLKGHITN